VSNPHLTDYNESERTEYMMVVASMAGADGDVTTEEIYAIRALSLHFVLGPEARGQVMASCTATPEEMEQVIKRFAESRLKFSLLLDLANMAWADGALKEPEEAEIHRLGGLMQVEPKQIKAVLSFAETLSKNPTQEQVEQALKSVEAAGVDRNALALSATLYAQQSKYAAVSALFSLS
jgi:uncharacterized tellurite resistance protein B-like protein